MTFTRIKGLLILLLTMAAATMAKVRGATRDIEIFSPEDYMALVASVNSGASHAGTTVRLVADLDLTTLGTVDPIGKSPDTPFLGAFDGQGHAIRNMTIKSSQASVGMIGYSADANGESGGATVSNLVLDTTCTVQSAQPSPESPESFFLAAFIGSCTASERQCRVDSCVNMGSVLFTGSPTLTTNVRTVIGGILGGCHGNIHGCVVENCVNYGTLTRISDSLSSSSLTPSSSLTSSYIGGIVGLLSNGEYAETYIKSCFNYGTLVDKSSPSGSLYIGGVVAYGHENTTVYACANMGTHTCGTLPEHVDSRIGGIAGRMAVGADITYGFWRADAWGGAIGFNSNGDGGDGAVVNESLAFVFESLTTVDDDNDDVGEVPLYDALSNAAEGGAAWLYGVECVLNGGEFGVTVPSPLIVPTLAAVPTPTMGDTPFCGWCTDPNLTAYADMAPLAPSDGIKLYAKWYHTISFEMRNSDETAAVVVVAAYPPINAAVGEAVTLPNVTKCGYAFLGWVIETPAGMSDGTVYYGGSLFVTPGHEVTFSALFERNEYSLRFYDWDENPIEGRGSGGSSIPFGTIVDSSHFPAQTPSRDGFAFDGWVINFDDKNAADDGDNASGLADRYRRDGNFSMPCHNVTFTAKYVSDSVKVVFSSTKTDSEANYFIDKLYSKRLNAYDIVEIGVTSEEEEHKTYVIILFQSTTSAKKFYDAMEKWVASGSLSSCAYVAHFEETFSVASFSATILPFNLVSLYRSLYLYYYSFLIHA